MRSFIAILYILISAESYSQYYFFKDKEIEIILQKVIDLKIRTKSFTNVYDKYFSDNHCYLENDSLANRDIKLMYNKNKSVSIISYNHSLPLRRVLRYGHEFKDKKLHFVFSYSPISQNVFNDSISIAIVYKGVFEKKENSWDLIEYKIHERHIYNEYDYFKPLFTFKEQKFDQTDINDRDWQNFIQEALNTQFMTYGMEKFDEYFKKNQCYLVTEELVDKKMQLVNKQGKKIKVVSSENLPKEAVRYIKIDRVIPHIRDKSSCRFVVNYCTNTKAEQLKDTIGVNITNHAEIIKTSAGYEVRIIFIDETYDYYTLTWPETIIPKDD